MTEATTMTAVDGTIIAMKDFLRDALTKAGTETETTKTIVLHLEAEAGAEVEVEAEAPVPTVGGVDHHTLVDRPAWKL
jgi:hypothetical protein